MSRNSAPAKEKAHQAMAAYLVQLGKVAENAMLANLLNDYHAVFWLAHSFDLARQFSSVPRRVSAGDTPAGPLQGDAFKYRIYARWAQESRDQMTQLPARGSGLLDGAEQRGL